MKRNYRHISWLVGYSLNKILAVFGHAYGPALESDTLHFKTLLHNFTSISIMIQNFRKIGPVVTENSSGQNLGGKKKKPKKRNNYNKI